MAFVPVAAAVGVAVAGASVGCTALGFALSLRDRMKHTTTPITHLMNVTEGDHISLKKRASALPFRHAIVIEQVREPQDKVCVVFHCGSRASARVEYAEVDLHELARSGELVRHRFDALISYPGEC